MSLDTRHNQPVSPLITDYTLEKGIFNIIKTNFTKDFASDSHFQLYRLYLSSYGKCHLLLMLLCCTYQVWYVSLFPEPFLENLEMGGESYPAAKNLLNSPTRKIPLTKIIPYHIKSVIKKQFFFFFINFILFLNNDAFRN